MKTKDNIGIYIHIPFCDGKCPYCDFYSVLPDKRLIGEYTQKICEKIEYWSGKLKRPADTLYIGGGTPNLIGSNKITKIIKCAKKSFGLGNAEITMELNPATGKEIDFEGLKNAGVNRLSIGLQSSNSSELKSLGRKHSLQDVINTISLAQKYGLENISLDIMIGVQHQTKDSLYESIKFCLLSKVKHVSAYLLKIEKDTPYYFRKQELVLPSDEEQYELYMFACEKLENAGFSQYEISNFSQKGYESKHNLKYWNLDEYLGIGSAAHSFIDGKRFFYTPSVKDFISETKFIEDGSGGGEDEYIMLKLRLSQGFTNKEFKERFGYDIPGKYKFNCNKYRKSDLLICDDNSIKLTRKGFMVSNQIICDIIGL